MTPELITSNLFITLLKPEHLPLLIDYQNVNREHLAKWEPVRTEDYFSRQETKKQIDKSVQNFKSGKELSFVSLNKTKTEIIGLCTFSDITYSRSPTCHLGYSLSARAQGKGLMFEMLQCTIDYLFEQYHLQEIKASYMPDNSRSENLLVKLGFEKEGFAKGYLRIAGQWEDHILMSKIAD
ncbi:alanine acetyltransferase [Psychromonas marina]|uniref:Alanine acetyltransferase n=1 Tax=Psychromonas marina TaxID=88364 RepID=A0ABQ6DYJ4_9GAMM|nr:GNAT family N-acetyltransferase [Psychromonas marina]GLS90053.1 alanine acetyltransferase [Psychromonas marina]